MTKLRIETIDGRSSFAPGETIDAAAEWQLDSPADAIELRLVWYTHGSDEEEDESTCISDSSVVERLRIESPAAAGAERWTVRLPNGPYSFSGLMISLNWALELAVEPGDNTHRLEITIAPCGAAIVLHPQTRDDVSA